MDPRNVPAEEDGPSPTVSTPPLRRRLSMEEDYFYQEIMTSPPRPSQPPPYKPDSPVPSVSSQKKENGKGKQVSTNGGGDDSYPTDEDEELPGYSNSIFLGGIFSKKHEIENTTKRAEDRQWHTAYVTLTGTALSIHRAKKDWGWGRTRDDGPSVDPDNPPWMRKGAHEKTYSLLYADVGIAADYKKRRYVIRVRAETDQFLLSCVELSTFVKWLEGLFAAIDVAPTIDDRDFPRDMSIPRIQRIRWFRGQPPTQTTIDMSEVHRIGEMAAPERRASASSTIPPESQTRVEPEPDVVDEEDSPIPPPRIDPVHRLSTTSYPNLEIDPGSGKWLPEHQWSSAHDMLYAKLCYSNLLFRSPRKSNYIISKGKQWFVDWQSGRMVRVLPPAYGEIEWFGPWQVIHTENRRI
ncbi:Fc.00g110750.m01.CDS01 [Cosmosporella sp. VM-42]